MCIFNIQHRAALSHDIPGTVIMLIQTVAIYYLPHILRLHYDVAQTLAITNTLYRIIPKEISLQTCNLCHRLGINNT